MAKISLRDYNREIEQLIESGHTDEATVHCRYILQKYPKYIDTYRLLGKAYLETQRYSDASDILQRVLSSVPDDFVAHLGMSIIREDESNLSAAIWHMERAFEVQPANAAIQTELRRLYGRRDGLEPPKIHLTRGALARMYAKGNLHRQAIGELRAALAEDPERPDLQVLLARMYLETGQRVEAVETCSNLLRKLPYCLEANRILAKILPGTDRASEAQIYQQHVQALDPYSAYTSKERPSGEQVPDTAITLEKYEWTPGESPLEIAEQPSWATTLGVQVSDETQEEVPDWLKDISEKERVPERPEEQESEEIAGSRAGEMPEWLSSEEEVEGPGFETGPEEEIAQAEIPDWLQSIAPTEAQPDEIDEEAFDWSEELGEVTIPEDIEGLKLEGEAEVEIPDWLREMDEEGRGTEDREREEEIEPEVAQAFEHEPEEAELPEWMMEEGVEAAAEEAEIPEWIRDLEGKAPEEVEPEEGEIEFEAAQTFEPEPEEAEVPDWMMEEGVEAAAEEAEVPEWPSELGSERPEEVEEEETELEAAQTFETEPGEAEMPEWLQDMGEVEAEPQEEGAPESDLRALAQEMESEKAPTEEEAFTFEAAEDEDAALAWLENLAQKQGAPEEELLTTPDKRQEAPPEWVQDLAEKGVPEEEIPQEETPEVEFEIEEGELAGEYETPEAEAGVIETPEEEIPEWLRATQAGEEGPGKAEELPEWMVGAEEGTPPEEIEELVEEEPELEALEVEVPDWLQQAEAEQTLPDWLQDVESDLEDFEIEALEEEGIAPAMAESEITMGPEEDLPDWLQGLGEEPEPEAEVEPEPEHTEAEISTLETQLVEPPILGDTQPVRLEHEEAGPQPAEPKDYEAEEIELEAEVEETVSPYEAEEVPALEEMDEEATMAWLESLAAEQGAPEEELLASPEERSEELELPEWLREIEAQEEATSEPEILEEEEESFEMEKESEEAEAEIFEAEAEERVVEPEPSPPAMEEVLESEVSEAELVDARPEEGEALEPELAEEEMALPPEAEEGEVLIEEPEEAALEPQPLIDLNAGSLADLEKIPGIGFTMAQNIVAHRETYGPFQSLDDLQQVPGIGPVTVEEIGKWVSITVEPEAVHEPIDSHQAALQEARDLLAAGEILDALEKYNQLIKSEESLDTIITDLQGVIDRHPVEVELYQTLGDAYMREDRLQEALDAYTKAEDLLR